MTRYQGKPIFLKNYKIQSMVSGKENKSRRKKKRGIYQTNMDTCGELIQRDNWFVKMNWNQNELHKVIKFISWNEILAGNAVTAWYLVPLP